MEGLSLSEQWMGSVEGRVGGVGEEEGGGTVIHMQNEKTLTFKTKTSPPQDSVRLSSKILFHFAFLSAVTESLPLLRSLSMRSLALLLLTKDKEIKAEYNQQSLVNNKCMYVCMHECMHICAYMCVCA